MMSSCKPDCVGCYNCIVKNFHRSKLENEFVQAAYEDADSDSPDLNEFDWDNIKPIKTPHPTHNDNKKKKDSAPCVTNAVASPSTRTNVLEDSKSSTDEDDEDTTIDGNEDMSQDDSSSEDKNQGEPAKKRATTTTICTDNDHETRRNTSNVDDVIRAVSVTSSTSIIPPTSEHVSKPSATDPSVVNKESDTPPSIPILSTPPPLPYHTNSEHVARGSHNVLPPPQDTDVSTTSVAKGTELASFPVVPSTPPP